MTPPSTTGKVEEPFKWFLGQLAVYVGKDRTKDVATRVLAQVADAVGRLRKAVVSH